jgi:hypothetical protein
MYVTGPIRRDTTIDVRFVMVGDVADVLRVTVLEME